MQNTGFPAYSLVWGSASPPFALIVLNLFPFSEECKKKCGNHTMNSSKAALTLGLLTEYTVLPGQVLNICKWCFTAFTVGEYWCFHPADWFFFLFFLSLGTYENVRKHGLCYQFPVWCFSLISRLECPVEDFYSLFTPPQHTHKKKTAACLCIHHMLCFPNILSGIELYMEIHIRPWRSLAHPGKIMLPSNYFIMLIFPGCQLK